MSREMLPSDEYQSVQLIRLLAEAHIQHGFHVSDDGHFHIELWDYNSVEKLITALISRSS